MNEKTIDYFDEFDLPRSAGRKANLEELNRLWLDYSKKKSKKAQRVRSIIEEAQDIFKDSIKYEAYLQRLDDLNYSYEPDSIPVQQEDAASNTAAPEAGGWKSLLAKAAIEVGKEIAKAYVENKQQARAQEDKTSTSLIEPQRTTSVAGVWVTGDGLPIQFAQSGNQIQFQGVNPHGVVVLQGTGSIQGHQLQLGFRYFDGYVYDDGQAVMEVSSSGRQMKGYIHYARMGQRYMVLVKGS